MQRLLPPLFADVIARASASSNSEARSVAVSLSTEKTAERAKRNKEREKHMAAVTLDAKYRHLLDVFPDIDEDVL